MRRKKCWSRISQIFTVFTVALMLPLSTSAANTYKILYRFTGARDGGMPNGVILDKLGNLYGTTRSGGATGKGIVFELERRPDGSWNEIVLHSFRGPDGAAPFASLVFDTNGNLYGTTSGGGPRCIFVSGGCGVVFKLRPNPNGTWTESVLYEFKGGPSDGATPLAKLIFDGEGNLYGTTSYGGPGGAGDIFELKPNANGTWTENILYMFSGNGPDGYLPFSGLVFDTAGNLYGATSQGGNMNCPAIYGCGVIFRLKPNSDGKWTESVLHIFCSSTNCADGRFPESDLVFDKSGNLYGTTTGGEVTFGDNTVFILQPRADGTWKELVLHRFRGPEGANPLAGLVFDAARGDFYGTASSGGPNGDGTVFKVIPEPAGKWQYSIVHSFLGQPALTPTAGAVLDDNGNLYGTTSGCGLTAGCQGVVFEVTP